MSDIENDITLNHKHYSHRSPFLRASVLGSNDGLISISAILLGVGVGTTDDKFLLLAAISAIVGGSLSMALGEYISVSTQKDSEKSDIAKEIAEHESSPEAREMELRELTQIYVEKGLTKELARQVAQELSKNNVIKVHMKEELGIDIENLSSPSKAAFFSGTSFLAGSIIPLLSLLAPRGTLRIIILLLINILLFLTFAILSAKLGGAPIVKPCIRIVVGGVLALGATYAAGIIFSTF